MKNMTIQRIAVTAIATVEIEVPITLKSESNCSEHWTKKSKRHNAQKELVKWQLKNKKPPNQTPVEITLTRIAPRYMDKGNLVSSFKWVEDAIAEYFHPGLAPGRADGLGDIEFFHRQEKGKPKENKITIAIKYLN